MLCCTECGEYFEHAWTFGLETITCPHCHAELETEYDETYDPETGEENCYEWVKGKVKTRG